MIRAFLALFRKSANDNARWTADDEAALADAKASHGRRSSLLRRKSAAMHDALAREVWGSSANGWRGTR